MAAIDVGPGATNRASAQTTDAYTYIDVANAANLSGIIDTVELWFNTNATGVKVGTFSGSGTSYTSRGVATIGNVTAGSKQTFTGLGIPIQAGDFIGIYWTTGDIELDTTGGSGFYYKSGDQFGAGAQTYTLSASQALSIYATGTEVLLWSIVV